MKVHLDVHFRLDKMMIWHSNRVSEHMERQKELGTGHERHVPLQHVRWWMEIVCSSFEKGFEGYEGSPALVQNTAYLFTLKYFPWVMIHEWCSWNIKGTEEIHSRLTILGPMRGRCWTDSPTRNDRQTVSLIPWGRILWVLWVCHSCVCAPTLSEVHQLWLKTVDSEIFSMGLSRWWMFPPSAHYFILRAHYKLSTYT